MSKLACLKRENDLAIMYKIEEHSNLIPKKQCRLFLVTNDIKKHNL